MVPLPISLMLLYVHSWNYIAIWGNLTRVDMDLMMLAQKWEHKINHIGHLGRL